MEIDELITAWQANDAKVTKAVQLNIKTLDVIISQKVKSALTSLLWQRLVEISFHAAALILLVIFLAGNIRQLPYAISAAVLIVFYGFLFINCFKQIQIIITIERNKNIVSRQKALMQIQTHLLNFVRLSVLCIPAFLSYPPVVSKALANLHITVFDSFDIVEKSNGMWWYAEIISYVILIPLGVWFYKQVSAKNMHKKWVARIIRKSASARVTACIAHLGELDELKTID